jgi:hypothetical protein
VQEFKQAVTSEVSGATQNLIKALYKANSQLQKHEKEKKEVLHYFLEDYLFYR